MRAIFINPYGEKIYSMPVNSPEDITDELLSELMRELSYDNEYIDSYYFEDDDGYVLDISPID